VLDSLVTGITEARKGIAAFQALEAQLMAAAYTMGLERVDGSRGDGDMPIREVAAEIGAAMRVSDRSVQRQMVQAQTLTTRFPATVKALASGVISRSHANVIVEAGDRIEDTEARGAFETAALSIAERETAGRLRPIVKLLAERVLPRSLTDRHRAAAADRTVSIVDLDDGMAQVLSIQPAALAHGMHDRITQMAQTLIEADPHEERSLDQLRADLLADLVLTGAPSGHEGAELLATLRAEVHVSVPALTLAGRSEEPAMLDGRSPVDVGTARILVGGARGWDRVLTHPVTGAVLAVDRYQPSAEMRRFLRATDQRCRFPGCSLTVRKCDLDHLDDFALGGKTHSDNLAHECRRHHVLKHHSAWSVKKMPDGVVSWTSPTGRTYPDRTPLGVFFGSDPPPG
jgi:hypothetical protein